MKYLPAEWEQQSGVLLVWPRPQPVWGFVSKEIELLFAKLCKAISDEQQVLVICEHERQASAIAQRLHALGARLKHVRFYHIASDNVWIRDIAPLTVLVDDQPSLLKFGLYPAASTQDNLLLSTLQQQPVFQHTPWQPVQLNLAGGSIEVDGQGTLLTTQSYLMAEARNPQCTVTDIEQALIDCLGVSRVVWLQSNKLVGDTTDGYVDMLVRFVSPTTLCYASCDNPSDENFAALQVLKEELRRLKTVAGRPYHLIPLPIPSAKYSKTDGRRLAASYCNFVITNNVVLVPVFQDIADDIALKQIRRCFFGRKIIPLDSLLLLEQSGNLHRACMQFPEGVL